MNAPVIAPVSFRFKACVRCAGDLSKTVEVNIKEERQTGLVYWKCLQCGWEEA